MGCSRMLSAINHKDFDEIGLNFAHTSISKSLSVTQSPLEDYDTKSPTIKQLQLLKMIQAQLMC